MTDGVSDTDFEDALGEAKAEGNLSRANVVRKIRQRRGARPRRAGRCRTRRTGRRRRRHAAGS